MKDLSNENVIHVKKDGIEYLQFRKLLEYSDIIKHAYAIGLDKDFRTARAKNATPLTNEEYEKAVNDYRKLADSIGIDYINIAKPNQAHTKNIKVVEKKVKKDQPDFNLQEYAETDGLVTNTKNIALATTNADCILLLFFDPVKKVIANVHSGWRGTLQRISIEAVNKMKNDYGCNPTDIICCICPSIRKCHFKVHKDVQEPFYNEFKDLKEIGMSFIYELEETKNIEATIFMDNTEVLVDKEFIKNNLDNENNFKKMNVKLIVKNKED